MEAADLKNCLQMWLNWKSHNKYLYIHELLFKGKHWLQKNTSSATWFSATEVTI